MNIYNNKYLLWPSEQYAKILDQQPSKCNILHKKTIGLQNTL